MSNSSVRNINPTTHDENKSENEMDEQNNENSVEKQLKKVFNNKAKVYLISHNVSEQNDENAVNEKESKRLSQSTAKVSLISNEDSWTKMNKLELPSVAKEVTVINMDNKPDQKFNNKNLEKINKKSRYLPQHTYLNHQKETSLWVQFSFGQGSGGIGKGGDGGDLDYDPESRNSFVLLVMLIVLIMLLITAGWLIIVFKVQALFDIFRAPSLLMLIGIPVCLFVLWFIVICIPIARKPPFIFIMTLLVLIFMCLLAAMVTCRFKTEILIYAFFATAATVFVCTLLACSSFDFTSYWLYFIAICMTFSVIALCIYIGMLITGTYMKTLHIIILCISTLLNVVGLIMELQMILGGKSIEMSEDDYCLGALMLYTSIVKIFLNLVQLIGISLDS